jgi:hypothetical protein
MVAWFVGTRTKGKGDMNQGKGHEPREREIRG